jgi:hypothetical protein
MDWCVSMDSWFQKPPNSPLHPGFWHAVAMTAAVAATNAVIDEVLRPCLAVAGQWLAVLIGG